MSKRSVRLALLAMVGIGIACLSVHSVSAQQDSDALSPGFRFTESVVGGGGLIQSNSASYETRGFVLGDTAVGETNSSSYTFGAGNKTTPDPTLSVNITGPSANFGNFSPTLPAGATATFSVIDYTSYGYAVFISGDPLSYNGHTLPAMSASPNDISSPGTEQFGMNLVANSPPASPLSLGANFSYTDARFGKNAVIDSPYDTNGHFQYIDGSRVAHGASSSGETNYTISYIVNVSPLTPGGIYTSNQTIIVTGTY